NGNRDLPAVCRAGARFGAHGGDPQEPGLRDHEPGGHPVLARGDVRAPGSALYRRAPGAGLCRRDRRPVPVRPDALEHLEGRASAGGPDGPPLGGVARRGRFHRPGGAAALSGDATPERRGAHRAVRLDPRARPRSVHALPVAVRDRRPAAPGRGGRRDRGRAETPGGSVRNSRRRFPRFGGRAVSLPQTVPVSWFLVLAALLFAIGVAGALTRRNGIGIFLSIELMLNAANVALVGYSRLLGERTGQIMVLFVMAVAAAEAAVGLGLFIAVYRQRRTIDVNRLNLMRW